MQNRDRQQCTEGVSLTARALKRRTATGLLGLVRRTAQDVAVKLAVWADDPRNHEESLSLQSTLPALTTQKPSGG
jgi:hypothetical protein